MPGNLTIDGETASVDFLEFAEAGFDALDLGGERLSEGNGPCTYTVSGPKAAAQSCPAVGGPVTGFVTFVVIGGNRQSSIQTCP